MAALCLGGCTLPYQQLATPDAIGGEVKPKVPRDVAIGNRGGAGAQSFPGSGNFAVEPVSATQDGAGNAGAVPAVAGPDAGSAAVQVSKDGVMLNLVEAPIEAAAKAVLGEVLGVNYVVASGAKGTITLRTTRPVSKDGLRELFDAALGAEKLALVVEGNVYTISPMGDALADGAPLRTRARAGKGGGFQTDIMPLRYVSAAEMERIIKAAAPNARVLRADSDRNLIMVSGTRNDLASIGELVQVFDVDSMRGMSVGIYPTDTSDPEAIAQELDTVFLNDHDSPTKGIVRFIGNRRLKSVLVISSRPEYLKKAETWIKRLDLAASANEKQVHIYHVQNRPAAEVAQLLQKVFRNVPQSETRTQTSSAFDGGLTSAQPAGSADPAAAKGIGAFAAPQIGAGLAQPGNAGPSASGGFGAQAQVPGQAFGSAQDTAQVQTASLSTGDGTGQTAGENSGQDVSIVADEPNNSVIITATPATYRRVRGMLQTLDVPGTQVMIEATIAEVTLNDELKLGVRWFFEKGSSQIKLTDSALGLTNAVFPGFSYFLQVADINAVVRALSTVTDVNIVSTPTLMVVENKKATLQIGDEVPIVTQSAVSVTTPDAPIVNAVSFRSTGVILGITSRVSDTGNVVLDIEQEVSDVVATTSSTINSPTIQQRRVKTTVNVQDGQTVLLAGLIQDRASRERGQVPLLGNIPYLGNAFKTKTDSVKRTELLIAITPQVIKNGQQLSDVTAEFRDKLNFTTRPQRETGPDARETFDRLAR